MKASLQLYEPYLMDWGLKFRPPWPGVKVAEMDIGNLACDEIEKEIEIQKKLGRMFVVKRKDNGR